MVPKSPDCRIQEISMIKSTTAEKRAKRENCQFSNQAQIFNANLSKISEILYSESFKSEKPKIQNTVKTGENRLFSKSGIPAKFE